MNEPGSVVMWRGKRVDELTHAECLLCIRDLGRRLFELEALPIDWRQHARNMMNRRAAQ